MEFGNVELVKGKYADKEKFYIIDSAETNNFNDSQIMQKIGGLWQKVAKLHKIYL
jgi:hypothetical protein